jgi:long-subunit fatty acid transport protein
VGGLIGVKRTSDITLDVTDTSGNAVLSGAKFYKAGLSWSSGLEVGFRYDVTKNLALGLETGFRIEGNLEEDTSELHKVNSAGNRWDIPVQVGLTYKF